MPSALTRMLLLGLVSMLAGPPDAWAGKPLPAVEVGWTGDGEPRPGQEWSTTVRVTARRPVGAVELIWPGDTVTRLSAPPPVWRGRPTPETPLEFPVRVRAAGQDAPDLHLRVRVESPAGEYFVGARLSLLPPAKRTAAARGGRLTGAGEAARWEFPAAAAVAPRTEPERRFAPAAVITGRFLYEDRIQDPAGFVHQDPGQNPLAPMRFADVEFLLDDVVIDTGSTDSTGAFAFTTTGPGEYRVRVVSSTANWSGSHLRVRFSSANPVPFSVTSGALSSPLLDTDLGDLVSTAAGVGAAFNILDSMVEGARAVRDLSGAYPSVILTTFWNANHASGTFFSRGQSAIFLLGDDGYDDAVILHEVGHYVLANYSADQNPGGIHFVDDSGQDPRLSWSEGFASFFQSMVREQRGDAFPTWYIDTTGGAGQGNLFFSYEGEEPSLNVQGAGSEVAVQAMLWDIIDTPSTPGDPGPGTDDDALSLAPLEVWEVLTGPMTTAATLTVEDFWDGWFSPGIANGFQAEMEAVFGALGAEFFPDAWETGDAPGTASPLALDGSPLHRTFYPAGDTDYHALALLTGESVTVETLNILSYGDTRLEILDPSLTVVAGNDDKGGSLLASLATYTAAVDGVHYARVLRSFADTRSSLTTYGSYDIRAVRAAPNNPPFVVVPGANGTADTGFGIGAAFADYNGDRGPDLLLVNNGAAGAGPGTDALFRNLGQLSFARVTAEAGLSGMSGGVAAAWGDYNNDGHPDFFVSDHGLFENDGAGGFLDRTLSSGVTDLGREFDAAWADADGDGWLDLFVAVRNAPSALWHNQQDGTFVNVAPTAGFNFPLDGGEAAACAWGDFDNDFRPDLFVGFRGNPGHALYRNLGNNQFEDVTLALGVASADAVNGAVWADLDDDGWLDLFLSSPEDNKLYLNQSGGGFVESAAAWGVNAGGTHEGAGFSDMDLDGDLDLYVTDLLGPNLLYEQVGGTLVGLGAASDEGLGLGCAWADVDGDGDEDLYVARGCSPCQANLLYENKLAASASPRWLTATAEGTMSPRDGTGARIRLFTEDGVQHRWVGTGTGWASRSRLPARFGFREGARLDSVEVVWPSGFRAVAVAPDPGVHLILREDGTVPVLPPGEEPPARVWLTPAVPNPFTGATAVSFVLHRPEEVTIDVFDGTGRRVRRLWRRRVEAGAHTAGWDGADDYGRPAPAGMYFYRLRAGETTRTVKLVRTVGR